MPALFDERLSSNENIFHCCAAAHEDPSVEPAIIVRCREIGMLGVEHNDVGPAS